MSDLRRDDGGHLVILAGGLGTRLKALLGDLPKPMLPILDKPLLQHQIELAKRHGFTQIHLLTYYQTHKIQEALGDGSQWGVSLQYHIESQPRGTGGALFDALPALSDQFFVLYGDTLLDVDLSRMWETHRQRGADISLFLHPNDHPHDSDLVALDRDGWITAFYPYPHDDGVFLRNMVNAALYVVDRDALLRGAESAQLPDQFDLVKVLFPQLLAQGTKFYGYVSREYIKDVGTPKRLARAERALSSGLVQRMSLEHPAPAVFLDRDGTLNVEVNRVKHPDELVLLPGATAAVKKLNQRGLLAIVVTNQPVVARGDCSFEELEQIHAKLETLLGRDGAYLDRIYDCPHHPDSGFAGERPELKFVCECRKPATGMLRQAAEEFHLDLASSWMLGDTTSDLLAAKRMGVRAVLVRTGHAGRDARYAVTPDYCFADVEEAVDFIIAGHPWLYRQIEALLPAGWGGRLIAIGGLAMSGKSTLARVCQERLTRLGKTAHVLSLDGWIKPPETRGDDVLTRYDLDVLQHTMASLLAQSAPQELSVSHYDRATKRQREKFEVLSIAPQDVLILEGVPALSVGPLVEQADISFHVSCDETLRRQRFLRAYGARGLTPMAAEALFQQREEDEHKTIRGLASRATHQFYIPSHGDVGEDEMEEGNI